jgi:hypothetical protein
VTTPHVFIFDQQRKLRYTGRIDDAEKIGTAKKHDTRNAIEALLAQKEVPVKTTKTFGCSIKWSGKHDYIKYMKEQWAKEPVTLESIAPNDLMALLATNNGKIRLVNFWASWCGPCRMEFPELEKQQASTINYINNSEGPYELIETVGGGWQGAIPYTVILDADGNILYQKNGVIDPLTVKRVLVEKLGRHYQ